MKTLITKYYKIALFFLRELWLLLTNKDYIKISDDGHWFRLRGSRAVDFWMSTQSTDSPNENAGRWLIKQQTKHTDKSGTRYRIILPVRYWALPARRNTWVKVSRSSQLYIDYVKALELKK